ncbi:RES family NAD+ phosphorylase [Endothiovibrio diazotrophicus]
MASVDDAPRVELDWACQYRIIPSKYPPVSLYESLIDPDLLPEAYAIEALTNERLREEAGEIAHVLPQDRVVGPGSTPVMAAFTHPAESRFSNGDYGIYYAASTLETALAETRHSRAAFMARTREEPGEIDMRCYIGEVLKAVRDVRGEGFRELHHPDDWTPAQRFGREARNRREWGIVYRSVRHPGGECLAALRPPTVSIPRQGPHFSYYWDGAKITHVLHKRIIG